MLHHCSLVIRLCSRKMATATTNHNKQKTTFTAEKFRIPNPNCTPLKTTAACSDGVQNQQYHLSLDDVSITLIIP